MSLTLGSRSSSPDPQTYTRVILGLIIPGLGLTTVLLALYGYAAWNPASRRYLDRVSFRLLVCALVAHILFGVVFTIGSLTAYPGWRCSLLAFVTDLTLMFSAGMFFCIALNLPLVLVHHVNGQKMEKYYILGTALICLICNLAPYASGNLGWADVNSTCWYRTSSTNPAAMLGWLIGTQTFWIMLFALGEVGAFFIIVGYLVAYGLDTQATYTSETSHRAGSTILRLRNIVLRIGLYPLVSCLLNISAAVIDLYVARNYVTKHRDSEELSWRVNMADLAIYSGRPLIYGLLAATDPSFIRALRALRHPENEPEIQSHSQGSSPPWSLPSGCLSTVVDLPQDATTYEPHKDDAWGYPSRTHTNVGETSIAVNDLEAAKEQNSAEEHSQSERIPNVLPATQSASIDVECHI
ncbi:hypothetical protein B0H14DRAFT_799139 [Mycena olivaceomarginata]|nr:hypothetical protein B0H14DRAFT_799139 [Mycena olivaceomarginata]